ncbi:MAG: galactonate dehydratase [Candidatus Latescibacteria bacterium]|nr:galactonate dehydratase [Candidatus Latescibacterota bacterium]
MKISGINTYMSKEQHRNLIFVEVVTDEGMTGVGESYSVGPDEAIAVIVQHFSSWLTGMDPRDIEGIWQKLYRFSRFPGGIILMSAISGIDIALWDLAGKISGQPVWRLLGGRCRKRIRTYGHVSGANPSELSNNTNRMINDYGFTALKCFPLQTPQDTIPPWHTLIQSVPERMDAVKNAAGEYVDIAVDAHAVLTDVTQAVMLAKTIEPYHPLFLEEPARPENYDTLAEIVQKTNVPIATGEMLYTKWAFRELLAKRAAHIIQPDICIAGGITEMKKIAAVSESFHIPLAPHNPMGPIATAANVHLCATIPNFLILEYIPDDTEERCDIIDSAVPFSDGYLKIPNKPGLGIELNKEGLKKHQPQTWHRPFRYNEDGSVACI